MEAQHQPPHSPARNPAPNSRGKLMRPHWKASVEPIWKTLVISTKIAEIALRGSP
jgi:hypothetical protein